MKVYVVVEVWKGILDDPVIYLNEKDADKHVDEYLKRHDFESVEEANEGGNYEIHQYETEIIKPRMVLAGHRRAMARLEALCS